MADKEFKEPNRNYLMLRIKDENISKNSTITNIEQFIKKVKERQLQLDMN